MVLCALFDLSGELFGYHKLGSCQIGFSTVIDSVSQRNDQPCLPMLHVLHVDCIALQYNACIHECLVGIRFLLFWGDLNLTWRFAVEIIYL